MKKEVDLVLCTYNAEQFLEFWLKKFNLQTLSRSHIRIVAIDNCSSDGSYQFIKKNLLQDNDILIRNDKNLGHLGSLEKSLHYTNEGAIAAMYLAADDWLEPTYIEDALNAIVTNTKCHVAFGISYIDLLKQDGSRDTHERYCPYKFRGYWKGDPLRAFALNLPVDTALCRLDKLKKLGGWSSKQWRPMLHHQASFYFTNKPGLHSTKHGAQISKSINSDTRAMVDLGEEYFSLLQSDLSDSEKVALNLIYTSIISGIPILEVLKKALETADPIVKSKLMIHYRAVLVHIFNVLIGCLHLPYDGSLAWNNSRNVNFGGFADIEKLYFAIAKNKDVSLINDPLTSTLIKYLDSRILEG